MPALGARSATLTPTPAPRKWCLSQLALPGHGGIPHPSAVEIPPSPSPPRSSGAAKEKTSLTSWLAGSVHGHFNGSVIGGDLGGVGEHGDGQGEAFSYGRRRGKRNEDIQVGSALAGAKGSNANPPVQRTPAHTSFNFMRCRCRDTKLGQPPLGFRRLRRREAWTRFRAGDRTFWDAKVTHVCPPSSPPLSPYRPLHPQQLPGALPLGCFPFSHGNPALKHSIGRGTPSARDGFGSIPWDAPAGTSWGDGISLQAMGAAICWGHWWLWPHRCTYMGTFGRELCRALGRMGTHRRGPGTEIGNWKMETKSSKLWPPEEATRQVAPPATGTVPLSLPALTRQQEPAAGKGFGYHHGGVQGCF